MSRACPNRASGCRCERCEGRRAYQREWARAHYDPARRAARRPAREAEARAAKAWRAANPDRAREISRRWYSNHAERGRAHARAYRARNRDKVREAARRYADEHPGRMQAWADKNPDAYLTKRERDRRRLRAHRSEYEAARRAIAGHETRTRSGAGRRAPPGSEGACWICAFPMFWRHTERRLRPSRDHILPVTLGGRHEPSNLAWAHRSCNSARGNHRMPSDQSWSAFVEHRKARIGALLASCIPHQSAG